MVNFILELIDFNEGVDYSVVTSIVIIYLVLLWVFVSVWVFNDAKYRFNNLIVAGMLALLNLVLSFPFLLIYLLIRPSHRDDWDDTSDGGINIPIVNFTGKDGVVISLQLKIDSKKILDEKIDYNLDVILNKDNEETSTGKIEIIAENNDTESYNVDVEKKNYISKSYEKITKKFKSIFSSLKGKMTRNNEDDQITTAFETVEETSGLKTKSKSKKKNKKWKKKKNK